MYVSRFVWTTQSAGQGYTLSAAAFQGFLDFLLKIV